MRDYVAEVLSKNALNYIYIDITRHFLLVISFTLRPRNPITGVSDDVLASFFKQEFNKSSMLALWRM